MPLLQIAPSESNEERLVLIGPELASLLASIITRLRVPDQGTVPLISRGSNADTAPGPTQPFGGGCTTVCVGESRSLETCGQSGTEPEAHGARQQLIT